MVVAAGARRALLAHYRRHRRELPWRATRDPYAIWVSEVMLQQTQVATVKARYGEFLARFPSIAELAAAEVEAVCEAWTGLGYYRRARSLHAAARCVVEEHGGRLPETADELKRLPGIGRYTAGAIASIAHGEAVASVDGNVARVLSRMFTIDEPVDAPAGARRLWELAGRLVAGASPGDVNQALMDVGATICTPLRPRCEACPVARWCGARAAGRQQGYPRKGPRPAKRRLAVAFAWLASRRGLWLERRGLTGLWAGQWQPPGEEGASAKARLRARLAVDLGRPIARVRHELTHRSVEAVVYPADDLPRWRQRDDRRLAVDPLSAPLSALARKVVVEVLASETRRRHQIRS